VLKKLLVLTLLLVPVFAYSQVSPATRGGGLNVWVGAEYSNFKPDFGLNRLGGFTILGDVNDVFLKKLGFEGEARWLHINEYHGETEANYLGGPRYRLWRYHGLSVYGKFLMGGGLITFPDKAGHGSYFAYAPGGTVEYRLSRRWLARGDYEYQIWPSAPGAEITFPNPSHGLTPNGFSVGVSYKIF
jgi:hypothetical protein